MTIMRYLIVQDDCYIVHGCVDGPLDSLHVTLRDLALSVPVGRMAGFPQAVGKKMACYGSFTVEESLRFTRELLGEYRRLQGDAPELYGEFPGMGADALFTVVPTTDAGRALVVLAKASQPF
jgi:hypothetical protein